MARGREGRDTEIGAGRHRAEVPTPRQILEVTARGKTEKYDMTGMTRVSVDISGSDYRLEINGE